MIETELYMTRDDGVRLYRTYSDEGRVILQNETGNQYEEAIDVEGSGYTYTETDEYIEGEATEEDYQEALRELGVEV